jgi:2-dehydro-3-deoxy-D-gluconate 5-dehydrogenase
MTEGTEMDTPSFDLTGRLALVTGARRGIGLSMATALAAAGADILAVSATLDPDGGEVRDRVEQLGRRVEVASVDLGDRAALDTYLDDLDARGHQVDIVVNNAGTILRAPAEDHDDELWDRVLEVNLTAAFRLARRLGAGMLERGRGKIIFTASMLSFQGGINVSSYTASKSALAGITKTLANEWASRGVNVNAIAPGYIATDNTEALRDDPERSRAILDRIPAGRWGTPDDMAGATVFLASPASDYVHGIVLPVDGGWLGR